MYRGQPVKGCRYWGYEPESGRLRHQPNPNPVLRRKRKAAWESDTARLKAAGDKAPVYGLTQKTAEERANEIEKRTGVIMHTFNHDFF